MPLSGSDISCRVPESWISVLPLLSRCWEAGMPGLASSLTLNCPPVVQRDSRKVMELPFRVFAKN